MKFISRTYREMMQEMRAEGWGKSAYKRAEQIASIASFLRVESILDYGCGQGTLLQQLGKIKWEGLNRIDFHEYDPCVISKNLFPVPSDLVLCLDVLEHVEEEFVDRVILHLWALAKKFLLITVSLCEADAVLPDGCNAHLVVQPKDWWDEKMRQLLKGRRIILDVSLADRHKPEWSFLAVKDDWKW